MNAIKSMIQKEEFIALAVNKYILHKAKIPIVDPATDKSLDWSVLMDDDYLGLNFNKTNPLTGHDIIATFDVNHNLYLSGFVYRNALGALVFYSADKYLYNFYINRLFRVNTLAPETNAQINVQKGSQVIYDDIVKEIVLGITDGKLIMLDSENCPSNNYFYELKNKELTYKFCKGDSSVKIYQRPPILLEDFNDLKYVKAQIGDIGYAKKNENWFGYYYQGDVDVPWVPVESGSILHSQDEEEDVEDRIISYIPNSKDLVLRNSGGCMLANGDIFCWGNNKDKKVGIETYGQINTNNSPDFINTPVMLKVQIDDTTKISGISRRDKKWYNNPYRVKFEKMAFSNSHVCAISPIFDYFQAGEYKKFGGDLYCNGKLNSEYFEDISDATPSIEVTTSILKRNKFIATDKDDQTDDDSQNEIYLKDIAMIPTAIAVLSESGKIYLSGSNEKGALGINNTDESYYQTMPIAVNTADQVFKKLYALRNIKGFGAIDENNNFWMWGERPNGAILYTPTLVSSAKFDPDGIFVNSKDFVLRGFDKRYFRTYDTLSIKQLTNVPNTALSVSIYDLGATELYLYVDQDRKLKGSSRLLTCRFKQDQICGQTANLNLFNLALDSLNGASDEDGEFSNVSIFQIENVNNVLVEDFETAPTQWNNNTTTAGGTASTFLGRFGKNIIVSDGSEQIYRTYDFGFSNANKQVAIEFDMYEIDSWDANRYSGDGGITESFVVYSNGTEIARDVYRVDTAPYANDDTRVGTLMYISNTGGTQDEKHTYTFNTTLDSNGRIRLGFGAILGEDWTNESFGIDNIRLSVSNATKHYVCAMTGLGSASQMYCWGNPGRSLPTLSTSLYDVSKITNMNDLFVTQNSNVSQSMTYSEFDNEGNTFLKFPTYIGGFDYEFYFK